MRQQQLVKVMSNSFNNYRLPGVKGLKCGRKQIILPLFQKKIIILNNFVAQEEKFRKLEKEKVSYNKIDPEKES